MSKFNNMSDVQIYAQFQKDKEKLDYRTSRLIDSAKKDGIYNCKWHSPNGKEYRLFIIVLKDGKVIKFRFPISGVEGRESFFSCEDYEECKSRGMAHFTYHFMQRYMQRGMKHALYSEDNVLAHFITNNPTSIKLWENEDNTLFMFAMNYGIAFCKRDIKKNICHYCTFVSNDMLKKEQKEAYEKITDILKHDTNLRMGRYGFYGSESYIIADKALTLMAQEIIPYTKSIIQQYKDEIENNVI